MSVNRALRRLETRVRDLRSHEDFTSGELVAITVALRAIEKAHESAHQRTGGGT